jgi:energy-converting hydrogenase A subunit M
LDIRESGFTLSNFGLGAEGIQAQRGALNAVGEVNSLIQVLNGQDGNERTEALLCAQRILNRVNLNNGGLDEELLLVHGTTKQDLALGVIEHRLQALEVSLVDNARVIGRVLSTLGVELCICLLEFLDNSRHNLLINEQVVLRCANLARVQDLAPKHAARNQSRVGILSDDSRVDTAQLENNGGQVRGGGLGDDTTNVGTTREENLVPSLSQQSLCLGDTTLDDRVAGGVERGLADLLHNGGAAGSILGGLDDDGVTGGDGTDDGAHCELEGEVEGTISNRKKKIDLRLVCCFTIGVFVRKIKYSPDDQDAAQRILSDLRAHELEGKLDIGSLLILHPLVEVARGEDDVVEQPTALRDLGLEAWLVQVLGTSLDDLLLMVLDATEKVNLSLLDQAKSFSSVIRPVLTPSRACGAARDGTRHRGSCSPRKTCGWWRCARG